jgi:hypothetical protein
MFKLVEVVFKISTLSNPSHIAQVPMSFVIIIIDIDISVISGSYVQQNYLLHVLCAS